MNLKKKIYISLVIFLIVDFLFIFLLIYPFFKNIKKSSEDLMTQKTDTLFYSKDKENFKVNQDFYEANKEGLERINEKFIDLEVPVEFIRFLEKNAVDNQLSIEISPASTEKKENNLWPSIVFQISANGSFPRFMRFLEKIENSPYLTEITNLSLKKLTNQKDTTG